MEDKWQDYDLLEMMAFVVMSAFSRWEKEIVSPPIKSLRFVDVASVGDNLRVSVTNRL